MAKAFAEWKVLGNGPIEKLADNLWRVTGTLPRMSLPRTMVLARMADGRVLVHNGIALGEDEMKEIEEWGTPAVLVVPNAFHRLDSAAYKKRYPEAQVICPAGARKKAEEVIAVDETYDGFTGDDTVGFEAVPGIRDGEGVLSVRSADGVTLVFNDLLFNIPHLPGFGGFMMRMLRSSGGPRVTWLAQKFLVRDKAAVKARLAELADTPDLVRVIPGHGDVIADDPAGTLRAVADRL